MTFEEIFNAALAMLQRQGRVSYRALKRQFDLDDAYLEDLKFAIIEVHRAAVDQDNTMLVRIRDQSSASPSASASACPQEREPVSYTPPHLAEKILTFRSALEGERKQVTVLFCDLANSTALAERLGPEHMHTLLNRFFALALDAVHRYEGTINQFLGDGFMALFGAPLAHEDHARRAVLAALALQRLLQDHQAELGEPYGVTCVCRMGLNTGLVVVGSIGNNLRIDYSAIGDTTNLAARLQQRAEPGTILVSDVTQRLVEGSVHLQALPPAQVKGKTELVTPYKVLGTHSQRSPLARRGDRVLSQFVGRERELAALVETLEQVEGGQGQVIGIVAEAGGGKSRLLYELRQRLAGKRVMYLEGRCLSYGHAMPYHPIIDLLRNNCGITDVDGPETITGKVQGALHEVGLDVETSAPYLLQLLGVKEGTEPLAVLTPEAIKTRTFETLRQMSLHGSQQHPLIIEIEDLHWCDNISEECLAWLVESVAGAAILLLLTYRQGYRPLWLDKSYATQIALRHLGPQESVTVVRSARQHHALPEPLEQMIITKAEGNPFFLEELTRAVLAHADVAADATVPDTIQGVLMARIDRLGEASKRLLQTASVLGREVSPPLLEAIWDGARPLDPLLLDLTRQEFLFARTSAEGPMYMFKHALTQDVAYESLLTTRRQALHTAAGQALETLYAPRLEDAYERLAYHYARTDNVAKAVEYLLRVAEKATRNSAHVEAITHLVHGLELLKTLPAVPERSQQELSLHIALGASLIATKGTAAPEVAQIYTRAQQLCHYLEDLCAPLWGGRWRGLLQPCRLDAVVAWLF
jgi:class 3 adenylate cyclase